MAGFLKYPRGTRANFNTLQSGSGLVPNSLYYITDESRLVYALTVNTSVNLPGPVFTTTVNGLVPNPGSLDNKYLRDDGTWQNDIRTIPFIIDGGGSTIATGLKGFIPIDVSGTIMQWTLLGDQSGSIVVDIWKDTYANYPPVVGDSITASAKPTISSATKGQSSTLTGWTTSITAGDILGFNVDSVTSMQRVTAALKIKVA